MLRNGVFAFQTTRGSTSAGMAYNLFQSNGKSFRIFTSGGGQLVPDYPDTTMCRLGTDLPVTINSNRLLPNYIWNTGDTTWQITVTERGMYTLQSQFRCGTVSDSIFVDECPPAIFFPNAFTPNLDGTNDVFRAVVVNTHVERMFIYNRWGQKIYESNDPFPAWDGTFNNQLAPEGLYVYLVYYSDAISGFKQKQQRGTVMLVR